MSSVNPRPPRPRIPLWVVLLALAAAAAWHYARGPLRDADSSPAASATNTSSPHTSPATPPGDDSASARTPDRTNADAAAPRHDLSIDERRGGHTLARHVGRTDAQLADRLARERGISAASTYTDRPAAEEAVARALSRNDARIRVWLRRAGSHPNLALDDRSPRVIGRSLRRGHEAAEPSTDVLVVLRWAGPDDYYVLTSYPEARR